MNELILFSILLLFNIVISTMDSRLWNDLLAMERTTTRLLEKIVARLEALEGQVEALEDQAHNEGEGWKL